MSKRKGGQEPRLGKTKVLGAAIVVSLVVFMWGLGDRVFLDYDEAIYARVTHDTAMSSDVTTLTRGGQPFFEKPPLYFWMSMAIDRVIGVPEWSYRIPSALGGLACVMLAMLLIFEVSGSVSAMALVAAILLTSGMFVEAAREVRLDTPVVASILAAALFFRWGQRDRRWLLGIGLAVAVGVMFKLVIALLAGAYILVWSLLERNWGWLKDRYLWLGALAGLLVLSPWHIHESLQFGKDFWEGYLWHNVADRLSNDILGGSGSLATLAKFLSVYTAPWTIAFVGVVVTILAGGINPWAWEGRRREIGMFAATAIVIGSVFAASSTRIFYYLLPAYPFVALAVALMAEELRERVSKGTFWGISTVLLVIALWAATGYAGHRFAIVAINDVIAQDEAKAGQILAQNPEPGLVLTYKWPSWDTLGYYSGGRVIGAIKDGEVVNQSYYLIVHAEGHYSYPPWYQARLTKLYEGPALILYKYTNGARI